MKDNKIPKFNQCTIFENVGHMKSSYWGGGGGVCVAMCSVRSVYDILLTFLTMVTAHQAFHPCTSRLDIGQ